MNEPLDCQDIDCWTSYLHDTDAPDRIDSFENHLASCPTCQERLDRTAELGNALRALAREVGDPTLHPADPAFSQFIEQMCAIKPAGDSLPEEPADLYFLRPCARSGVLGMLGDYEVRELIGQGGMGVVLKAFDPALQRLVAIKVMAFALTCSATARRRFTREARAVAAVSDDNIVTVHSVEESDGVPYIVMQYVAGESLQARLDRTGPLEIVEVVRIGMQTAAGLAAAHAQGLIHRDIKPANLLLAMGNSEWGMGNARMASSHSPFPIPHSPFETVKITDFGLSRMVDDVGLTQHGVLAGTPEYMAPEQARGESVDQRTDLFSLGSVLYALCAGRPPFRGESVLETLRQVSEHAPEPLRQVNPDVPEWLDRVVSRLLAKDPSARYQSASELAALLECHLAQLQCPAPASPFPCPQGQTRARRHGARRWWISALVFLAILAPGAIALAWIEPPGEAKGLQEVFHHDFRGQAIPRELAGFNSDDGRFFREEAEGFRITLPRSWIHPWGGVGFKTAFGFAGNFEVTTTFEILKAEIPPDGYGVGMSMRVNKVGASPGGATLSRVVRAGGDEVVLWDISVPTVENPAPGAREGTSPCTEKVVRLRLKRTGNTLYYLWAPGIDGDNFQEVHQDEFGAEDIESVRLSALTGRKPCDVDVRLIDFRVRCARRDGDGAIADLLPGWSKGWLAMSLMAGLLGTGFLVVISWLYFRRLSRAGRVEAGSAATDTSEQLHAVAATVCVRCAGCGKRLRAKPALAGKKVKCPECGQVVHVPADFPTRPNGVFSWFARRRTFTALGFVVVLGLGLLAWNFESATSSKDFVTTSGQRKRWVFDFRKRIDEFPALALFGPEAESMMRTDAQGLRITLPEHRPDCNNVGVELPLRIHGDFDIDVGYELLAIGKKVPIPGAGVQLRIILDSPSPLWAVTRLRAPFPPQPARLYGVVGHDGEVYGAFRIITLPDGKEKGFSQGVRVRAQGPKGRLRLARTGSRLESLVAEEGSPYHLMRVEEIATTDVELVRLFGFSGWGPCDVDVRFTDLVIEADSLPDPEPSRLTLSKAWLAGGLGVGLLITLAVALAGWVFLRPGR